MDKEEIIKSLAGDRTAGLSEVNHIETVMKFEAVRRDSKGDAQNVTIEVTDTPQFETVPYHCTVKTDEKTATGNSAKSTDSAIKIVHWQDLD